MSKAKFLGLSGLKESGKSTAFEIIKEMKDGVVEIQLAKKLKDSCSKNLDIPRDYFDDQNFKEKELPVHVVLTKERLDGILSDFDLTNMDNKVEESRKKHTGIIFKTPREAAQYIGTEVLRDFDDDIHCVASLRDAYKNNPDAKLFVVTDMRFPNELEYFLTKDGFVGGLMIYRTEKVEALNKLIETGVKVHSSETSVFKLMDKCKIIKNDGTIDDLKTNIKNILKESGVL